MIAAGWAPPRAHRPGLRANMGGPMSRTRTETIVSSLLGRGDGTIRCPCVLRIGLSFESAVCVDVIERLLDEAGFADPEELRARFPHPDRRLACRPLPADVGRVSVARGARDAVLRQAFLLGLCTAQIYDPARPVLWTEASLGRGLELFDLGGFYS
ncbi:MAG: hypothetical protein IPH09_14790 [bacterium]|nr:hypothetical protein [bacterium]MBK9303965.1 hypothetical protein [bacterium]